MPGAAYRDFDAEMPALRTEEIMFKLGGEEFHCVPEAPGGVLADLIASIAYDDRGNQVLRLPNMRNFVEDILLEEREVAQSPAVPAHTEDDGEGGTREVPEQPAVMVVEPCDDLARWKALMHDKKRPIPIKLLVDVVVYLQGKYTEERPTEPSRR